LPAIVTFPLRVVVAALAATVNVTNALADPLAGATVIQAALDTAVQLQPAVDVTATATDPPAYATDALSGETV
jgi:hypothetical protein